MLERENEHINFFKGLFIATPISTLIWLIIFLLSLLLSGCGGCKERALKDAHEMSLQYETRIQVYEVLFPSFLYDSHAECQVKTSDGWKFYRYGKIEQEPEQIRKVKNTCFTICEFENIIKTGGEFEWKQNCGDVWPEPTWIDKTPIWLLIFLIII